MSAQDYKPSLSLVLAHEGGYINHPLDPGGPTNFGITQVVYDSYRKFKGAKVQSVKLINALEVSEIYYKQYWRNIKGDDLPNGLDYAVFDFAVNSGLSRATRYLQRLVGVKDDGVIGLDTLNRVNELARKDIDSFIIQYCENRAAFLKSLSTFPTFGRGWIRRVCGQISGAQSNDTGVIDLAINMATSIVTLPLPSTIGSNVGEIPAKAISENYDIWPIATQNDYLAKLIAEL